MFNIRGFSLLELLTTLIIIAILTTLAIPAWQQFIAPQQGTVVMQQLLNNINLARSEAIKRGVVITLCGSTDHKTCSGDWQQGQILFIDSAAKAQVQQADSILAVTDLVHHAGLLSWHASRSNDYLQFEPSGNTLGQAGTFIYCPSNRDDRFAQAIIVSLSGRARWVNNNGNNEHSQILKCA